MGVVSYEMLVNSSVPPAKLYKASVLDADVLLPKLVPQAIKSIEILEGDGAPGTITKVTLGEGSQFKYMKHKVDAIDKENFTFSHTVFEGDMLMNVIEKITYDIKFEQSPDGGSICKEGCKYYTIGDYELNIEQLKAAKERRLGLFKAIEAYILANPDTF
ncbi:hypothetical protein P3X46_005905 [Hevea brasiliensis]|uniref:Bet v I/Major latex protein domain-containing protein n=1 Tax=Hevea brasiliensis TaxID=3981 RepID=A0ABQ9MR61_HEVBR|nr:major allergen Pru ar 1-like [Hevea brasiliensis]KAJ9181858.1 hypothetical protein P3X46_005905 [Hevea brasiliensis]